MSDIWTLRRLAKDVVDQYGGSALGSWLKLAEWLEGEGLPSEEGDLIRFEGLIMEELDV